MRKISLIFIILFQSFLMAFSEQEISSALKRQAKAANIDEKVLYTLAKIESGFRPFLISFVSEHQNYQFGGVKSKATRYGNKYIITIEGDKKAVIKIAKTLIKDDFNIDVGLMQINSQNFKASEIEKMFELDYNIAKATKVLALCQDKYSNVASIIECYNKGYKQNSKFSYFNRFKQSYLRDFAGVKL